MLNGYIALTFLHIYSKIQSPAIHLPHIIDKYLGRNRYASTLAILPNMKNLCACVTYETTSINHVIIIAVHYNADANKVTFQMHRLSWSIGQINQIYKFNRSITHFTLHYVIYFTLIQFQFCYIRLCQQIDIICYLYYVI